MDITGLKPFGASLVLISSTFVIISWVITFFISHYRQLDDLHPTLSLSKYRWLVWPAIVGNSLYSKLFGNCNDSFFKSFSWRSAFIIFLISIFTNSLCIWLILGSAPDDAPTFQYEHLRFLLTDFFIFLLFNYLGDLISIQFTRYLLYKIATKQSNFIRYIFIDFGGILLGYTVNLIPVVGVGLYFMMTGDETRPVLEMGFLGTVLHPFFLIVFALIIDSIVFKIVVALSILSIAVPTLLFLFLSIFTYLLFVIFTRYRNLKSYRFAELVTDLLKTAAKIMAFIASVSFATDVLLPLEAKAEDIIPNYKLNILKEIENFNHDISIDPNNIEALIGRGRMYSILGQDNNAIDDYNHAISIDPNNIEALIGRGLIYSILGQDNNAIDDYNHAISIDPNNIEALIARGHIYSILGQNNNAIDDYNHAISIDPNNIIALNNRGFVNINENKLEEAVDDFKKLVSINARLSRYSLAYTYFLLKKPYHSTYWYIDGFLNDVDLSIELGESTFEFHFSTLSILRFIFGKNEKVVE